MHAINRIFNYLWTMIELIENNIDTIVDICKKHYVESVSLFGSAAKNVTNENSDVDLLVEFSDQIDVLDYADNYFSLKDALQSILKRKIDLISSRSLKNPALKEEIFRSKIDLYAA